MSLPYLLINLPLTDPTAPYHSIPYLVSAAQAAGFTGHRCLDANIAALNYLTREDQVEDLLGECARIRKACEGKAAPTRWEELLYGAAISGLRLDKDAPRRATEVLRDSKRFYDYAQYRTAAMTLKCWLRALSVRGVPGQFAKDFSIQPETIGSLSSVGDLTDVSFIAQLMNPFRAYFDGPFRQELMREDWALVGLSLNYLSQLPGAIYLTRVVRESVPASVICLGGTELADLVKYLPSRRDLWRIFPDADVAVVGEGESALVDVLRGIAAEGPRPLFRSQPGIIAQASAEPDDRAPLFRYESVATLPTPRYDVWDWSSYWSPEPVVLYSPTRGCYWNKCTFCDYGLNVDSPTSPSRERPVDTSISDLREIARVGRTLYLAVDAISSKYLRQWSEAVQQAAIDIRWSAEIRLERSLTRGLAPHLRKAGCVALSFGYESGTQRVLDLIRKGVQISEVPAILEELGRTGIGAQMMGFTGFPGETPEEAQETLDFLLRHQSAWTLAGIGDFALTPGSIVARRHSEFGIKSLVPAKSGDIVRSLGWIDDEGITHGTADDQLGLDVDYSPNSIQRIVDDRPFVGGIDSAHSILYFAANGPHLIPREPPGGSHIGHAPLDDVVRHRAPKWSAQLLSLSDVAGFRQGASNLDEVRDWLCQVVDGSNPRVSLVTNSDQLVLEVYGGGDFIPLTLEEAGRDARCGEGYRMLKSLLLTGRGVA